MDFNRTRPTCYSIIFLTPVPVNKMEIVHTYKMEIVHNTMYEKWRKWFSNARSYLETWLKL